MASLIGTAPNQCPTNGDLGGMAFQDPASVRVMGGTVCTSQSLQVPVTGFSIAMAEGIQALLLDPAGALAAGTITLPANPDDGLRVEVSSSAAIAALTVTANPGHVIKNAPTSLAAGGAFAYRFVGANSTWYRVL